MPGCCLVAAILFFGPRVVLFLAWLFSDWYAAFDSTLLGLLGFIFLPWTSLAWIFTHFQNGGELGGGYLLLLGLGFLVDVAASSGGARARRRRQDD